MIESDLSDIDRKLRLVLDDLTAGCNNYLSIAKGANAGSGIGKTKLDKERTKLCYRELVGNYCKCNL